MVINKMSDLFIHSFFSFFIPCLLLLSLTKNDITLNEKTEEVTT